MEGINLMNWPALSPNLNPIENTWSQLKRAINNQNHIPKNKKELIEAIHKEWRCIQPADFNKMISDMPKHIKACIKAKGGHTKW
jgi:hypothetical protein